MSIFKPNRSSPEVDHHSYVDTSARARARDSLTVASTPATSA